MESTDSTIDTRVQLEVWIDVACPWCFVGRRSLGVALADIEEHERPEVHWRAFQLDPTVPADGVDSDAYFAARYGADLARFVESRERLTAMGEELGIDFRWDRQRVVPNTHLAHRVLAAAEAHGEREPLLDALRELVVELLVDEDLAQLLVTAAIEDERMTRRVDEDIATARRLDITGVPCFVADRAIVVPGAVPPPVLAELLAEAVSRREDADADG
jgi:predicted DsbA family dithiol-disulfide isomerase